MARKKKIMIVDDEESVVKMLKMDLEVTGAYEVRAETKGANVVNTARQFRPNLILLDIMMPDIDGGEVANRIKSDPVLRNTAIVFLTAAVTKEEIASQNSIIGGHPFIAKPISTEDVISCIERYAK